MRAVVYFYKSVIIYKNALGAVITMVDHCISPYIKRVGIRVLLKTSAKKSATFSSPFSIIINFYQLIVIGTRSCIIDAWRFHIRIDRTYHILNYFFTIAKAPEIGSKEYSLFKCSISNGRNARQSQLIHETVSMFVDFKNNCRA